MAPPVWMRRLRPTRIESTSATSTLFLERTGLVQSVQVDIEPIFDEPVVDLGQLRGRLDREWLLDSPPDGHEVVSELEPASEDVVRKLDPGGGDSIRVGGYEPVQGARGNELARFHPVDPLLDGPFDVDLQDLRVPRQPGQPRVGLVDVVRNDAELVPLLHGRIIVPRTQQGGIAVQWRARDSLSEKRMSEGRPPHPPHSLLAPRPPALRPEEPP